MTQVMSEWLATLKRTLENMPDKVHEILVTPRLKVLY